ncbi:hypothetical protein SORBI_3007G108200 [Sorghum bicolor]|uniref:Uncharacterized protein n=1 Tax=Sorghum bicolor TaxID=4558 RepID=A0A1B6PH23_SORBI|nr:hypothetical protein SORBI_3007G108200 [Sorghum bicolor]
MAPYFCFFWFPPSLSFPAAPVTHSRAFRRVARRCSLLVVLHGGRPGSNARVSRGAPGGVSAGRPHRPAGLIPSLRPRCTRPIGVCAAAPSSLRVPGRGGRRLSAASTQSGWGCRCVPVFPPLRSFCSSCCTKVQLRWVLYSPCWPVYRLPPPRTQPEFLSFSIVQMTHQRFQNLIIMDKGDLKDIDVNASANALIAIVPETISDTFSHYELTEAIQHQFQDRVQNQQPRKTDNDTQNHTFGH